MGTKERWGEGLLYVSSDDPSVSLQGLSTPSTPYPPKSEPWPAWPSPGSDGDGDVWMAAKAWEALGLPMGARVGVLT